MLLADTLPTLVHTAPPPRHQKQLYSKKYGVHLARFTHKSTAVIYASTKENGALQKLRHWRTRLC